MLVTGLAIWVLWLAPIAGLRADHDALAARDFTALWAAGRLARDGAVATLSDPAAFTAAIRSRFGPGMPAQIWPYPPSILLLARPLAELPLTAGFLCYTLGGLAVFATALRRMRFGSRAIAALLLSPAVASCALAGQNGSLCALVLLASLHLLERSPVAAGLLAGLLSLKPQYAVLIPFCFAASGNLRALAISCVSALVLAFASAALVGYEPWVEFLVSNRVTITAYAGAPWEADPSQTLFSSILMAARSLGASLPFAVALQGVVTVGCAAAAWRLWSEAAAHPGRRLAATLALTLLASPWVHTYDMTALAISIVLLARSADPGLPRALLGLAWLWPGLSILVATPPAWSALCVAAVAILAARSRSPQLGSWRPA